MQGGGASAGFVGGQPNANMSASARFLELVEQLKVEFDNAVQEGKSFRGIRDEYTQKVEEQVAEISGMEQAICDLERRFTYMKEQYESEISRLKAQVQGGGAPPRTSGNTFGQSGPSVAGLAGTTAASMSGVPASTTGNLIPPQIGSVAPASKRLRSDQIGANSVPSPAPGTPGHTTNVTGGLANNLPSANTVRGTNGIMAPTGMVSMSSLPQTNSSAPQGMMPGQAGGVAGRVAPPPGKQTRGDTRGDTQQTRRVQAPTDLSAVSTVAAAPGAQTNMTTRPGEEDDYVVYQGRSNNGTASNINIKLQNTFPHDSVVCCVRYSWNGHFLATGSNRSAHVLDAASGARMATFSKDDGTEFEADQSSNLPDSYVRAVCFSPDGKWLITGAEDHVVKVWDVRNRTVKYRLQGHEADIYSVDASQDSSFIISGSGDKKAKIWSLQNGKLISTLGGGEYGPTDGITSVSVSPTSHHVAAGSLDKIVRVWDVESGTLVRSFEGHSDSVYSVAFSPDGRSLLSGSLDKTLKLWDLTSNQPGNQCRISFTGHKDFVLSVAFSPNGRLLISGSKDRSVQFWDPRQSSMCLMLQGHKNSVISIAHSPAAKSLATGSGDCRARTWVYTN